MSIAEETSFPICMPLPSEIYGEWGVNYTTFQSELVSAPKWYNAIYLFLDIIIVVLGATGNALVILAVATTKKLRRSSCNIFVVNLAIADLIVTGIVGPIDFIGFTHVALFANQPLLCEVMGLIVVVACLMSLLNLMVIAINRWMSICISQSYSPMFSKRRSIGGCVVLWILAFCGDLPMLLGVSEHCYEPRIRTCVWNWHKNVAQRYTQTLAYLIVPMTVTAACYTRIYFYVREHRLKMKALSAPAATTDASKMDRRVESSAALARTLFIVWVVFIVSWSPYIMIILFESSTSFWPSAYYMFARLGVTTNSCANAIIYGITNKNYNIAFRKLLRLDKCALRGLAGTRATPAGGAAPSSSQGSVGSSMGTQMTRVDEPSTNSASGCLRKCSFQTYGE